MLADEEDESGVGSDNEESKSGVGSVNKENESGTGSDNDKDSENESGTNNEHCVDSNDSKLVGHTSDLSRILFELYLLLVSRLFRRFQG